VKRLNELELGIGKFGHRAERNIYGLVWKDGELQW